MSTIDGREGFRDGLRSRGDAHPVFEYSFIAAQRIARDE